MAKRPSDALHAAAEIYEQRQAIYGDNYKRFGHVMAILFPDGLTLKTGNDFNRFGVLTQVVSKITRYAAQFNNGGHPDSLDDASVYAMMLQELDSEIAERSEPMVRIRPVAPDGSALPVDLQRPARF